MLIIFFTLNIIILVRNMPLPNVSAKTFSLSAVVIGYLLIDDLTANEQNALGNWLMLIAQVLCTNAFYKQVQSERQNPNNLTNEDYVRVLHKMINAMQQEMVNLKKEG